MPSFPVAMSRLRKFFAPGWPALAGVCSKSRPSWRKELSQTAHGDRKTGHFRNSQGIAVACELSRSLDQIRHVNRHCGRSLFVRNRVVTGLCGFGQETLKADMAVRCLDRPLSKIHSMSCRSGLSNIPAVPIAICSGRGTSRFRQDSFATRWRGWSARRQPEKQLSYSPPRDIANSPPPPAEATTVSRKFTQTPSTGSARTVR